MRIVDHELRAILELLSASVQESPTPEELVNEAPHYLESLRFREPDQVDGCRQFLGHLRLHPETHEEFSLLRSAMRRGIV